MCKQWVGIYSSTCTCSYLNTCRVYCHITNGVVYSESKYVGCGPAECDVAGRSALLWVSLGIKEKMSSRLKITLLVTT